MATPTLTPYSDLESEEEVEVYEVYEAGSDDVRNLITQPQEWQIACTGSTPAPSPIKVEPRPYRNWKPKAPGKQSMTGCPPPNPTSVKDARSMTKTNYFKD